MTSLGYLLPFLCALGCGADATTVSSQSPFTIIPQVTTTARLVSTSVAQSSPVVPSSAAATFTTVQAPTIALPTVSTGPTKPTSTVTSGPQATTKPTTVKTETVGVTSSKPKLTTITDNTPHIASSNANSSLPTNLTTASTPILSVVNSTVLGTSEPNITESAKELAATSHHVSRTSKQSNVIDVTNYSSTMAGLSTVSPSPMTISKTTAGSRLDPTTSLLKETTKTLPFVTYNLENIEVNCKAEHGGSLVKINIKPSKICGEHASMYQDDAKEILTHICTSLKPGYQPSKDKCHVDLGSANPGHLVILDAYVQSSLGPGDLYASLKHIKKDNAYLFQYDEAKYEEEDLVSIPLISAIVSLAVVLLIIATVYGCWHQRQTRKREQRLTEELQTMENGYHDNPTLEVMETSPEMQEKKGGPNGELGDSWIVPLDNLTREDFDEEEDTHL